jgi:hypothetical protein
VVITSSPRHVHAQHHRQPTALKELRRLISNTTHREALEQITDSYQRSERVAEAIKAQTSHKQTEARRYWRDEHRLRAAPPPARLRDNSAPL